MFRIILGLLSILVLGNISCIKAFRYKDFRGCQFDPKNITKDETVSKTGHSVAYHVPCGQGNSYIKGGWRYEANTNKGKHWMGLAGQYFWYPARNKALLIREKSKEVREAEAQWLFNFLRTEYELAYGGNKISEEK